MTPTLSAKGLPASILTGLFAMLLLPQPASSAPQAPKKLNTKLASPQVFRYKFAANQTRGYTVTMDQDMSMQGDGPVPAMKSGSLMKASMSQSVRSVRPNGSAVIETTYDHFDISVSNNGVKVPKEQLKPLAEMLQKMKSSSEISPRGEPKEMKLDGVAPEMQGLSDSMKSAMVGSSPIFPDKALKVGESWTQKLPMAINQGPVNITINFLTKYTFIGTAPMSGVSTSVFRTDISATVNAPKMAGPVPLDLTGSGKGLGYVYFDNARGELVKSELEMTQTTTMKITDPNMGASQTVELGQTTRASMSLNKRKSNKK